MERIDLEGMNPEFADLVGRAEAGETVEFTRGGRVVARLDPSVTPRKKVDVARLEALANRLPYQEQSAGDFIRQMRDEGY
jgi:antitoxin (DNA-binding transcriptional repressor) of toxin-antitoxin stability system